MKKLWLGLIFVIVITLGGIVSIKSCSGSSLEASKETIALSYPENYLYKDIKDKLFIYAHRSANVLFVGDKAEIYNFNGEKVVLVEDINYVELYNCPFVDTIMVKNQEQKEKLSVVFYKADKKIDKIHTYKVVVK